MKNRYWILILVGIIILAYVGGFLTYKRWYKYGYEEGLEKGYIGGLEKYGKCVQLCTRGFITGNYEDFIKISIDCMETCEFYDPNYGIVKIK